MTEVSVALVRSGSAADSYPLPRSDVISHVQAHHVTNSRRVIVLRLPATLTPGRYPIIAKVLGGNGDPSSCGKHGHAMSSGYLGTIRVSPASPASQRSR